MSQFYDLASLVVIPSGYKASTIYAQKPLTTDGQLSFSRASTATRVNASGLIEAVASNVPRLDYLGSTCPRLLLEPQRTNIVRESETFDGVTWTKYNGSTVTANTVISPDGTQNADTLTVSTTVYSGLYQLISGAAGNYVVSIFAKKGTKNWLYMFDHSAAGQAWFNLDTGTIGSVNTGYTATITPYGNGWFRCTMYRNSGGTPGYFQIGLSDANGVSTPTSTGTAHIWGAQVEAGSYATSYVKTEAAAVTRVADDASKTGISSLIGQTEGVLFVDFVVNGRDNNTNILNSEKNTTQAFFMGLRTDGNFDAGLYISDSLVGRIVTTGGDLSIGQRIKVAYAYKSGSFALYINGVQRGILSSTYTPVSTFDDIFLNDVTTYFNYQQNVSFNQLLLFKTRLTNAQLAELTTL
jgi:hypothetical protein